MPLFDVKMIQSYYCSQHKHKVKKQHRFCTLLSFNLTPFDWFLFSVFSKSRSLLLLTIILFSYFVLLLWSFTSLCRLSNLSLKWFSLLTYLHIFTDLKSKIQFGSVDLEFWVFKWYVLHLKVDLWNATTLNGGFFENLLEANQSNETVKNSKLETWYFLPSVHGIERWC